MMDTASLIRRCMEIAECGRGAVSPNPLVGCVITDNQETILAEGWHEKYGDIHAEVMALRNIHEQRNTTNAINAINAKMVDCTLYVSLEPCCTQGKQPPCTDAIIASGIRRVVFGARDSSNRGAEVLKAAGIEVIGPILESECRRQNRGFFSLLEKGRPWVTLKKAMTRDGRTANPPNQPRLIITSPEQDAWSHARLRATHDAILVGAGTIITDNPSLNIRLTTGHLPLTTPRSHHPRRIILDPHNEVPKDAIVLTDGDAERTLVIREKLPIPELLERLRNEGISSVLVEGGEGVWKTFEASGSIDEMVYLTQSG